MVLWWIGNLLLLLVVVPVLVALLNRVLAALERIRAASDDILTGGVALVGELDGVPEALATDRRDRRGHRDRRRPLRRLGRQAARLSRERKEHDMPAAAWVTIILATLIIAAAALGLIRVIGHLVAVRRALDGVVGGVAVVAHADQHRPDRAGVGQREPQARPRLLRRDLSMSAELSWCSPRPAG